MKRGSHICFYKTKMGSFFFFKRIGIVLVVVLIFCNGCLIDKRLYYPNKGLYSPHLTTPNSFKKPYEYRGSAAYSSSPLCFCNSFDLDAAMSFPYHLALGVGGQTISETWPADQSIKHDQVEINLGTYQHLNSWFNVFEAYVGYWQGHSSIYQKSTSTTDFYIAPWESTYNSSFYGQYLQLNIGTNEDRLLLMDPDGEDNCEITFSMRIARMVIKNLTHTFQAEGPLSSPSPIQIEPFSMNDVVLWSYIPSLNINAGNKYIRGLASFGFSNAFYQDDRLRYRAYSVERNGPVFWTGLPVVNDYFFSVGFQFRF